MSKDKNILISIHPHHAESILSGVKLVEFRKRFPEKCQRKKLFIYATSPIQRIVGEAEIYHLIKLKPLDMWKETKHISGVTREDFGRYFSKQINEDQHVYGILLKNVKPYKSYIKLDRRPPQSYMWWGEQ